MKNLKILDIKYRLIIKYRREFYEEDFINLNNTFIKPKYNFASFSKESQKNKILKSVKNYKNIKKSNEISIIRENSIIEKNEYFRK